MLFSDEEENYHLLVCSFISCYYIYYMPDIMLKIQGEEKQNEKKQQQTKRFPLVIIWNITLFWKIDLQINQWSESYNQSTGEIQSLNATWEKGFLERSHLWGEDGEGQFLKEIIYAKDGGKNVQVSSDRHGELKK